MEPFEVMYFGRLDVPGHYFYCRSGRFKDADLYSERVPFGLHLDGGILHTTQIADDPERAPGVRVVRQFKGWTVVCFWDRSGDSRPNSCSAFLTDKIVTEEQLLAAAKAQWPEVWGRTRFPIK